VTGGQGTCAGRPAPDHRARLGQRDLPARTGDRRFAAAGFLGIDGPAPLASVEDRAAFLAAYQHARGRRWTSADYAACWAAGLWQRAFDAKTDPWMATPSRS
jgi:hypothetical protein